MHGHAYNRVKTYREVQWRKRKCHALVALLKLGDKSHQLGTLLPPFPLSHIASHLAAVVEVGVEAEGAPPRGLELYLRRVRWWWQGGS